ncbi:MAG: DUF5078 domain-containing protein [Mycobacterium sp.]
MTISSLRNAAVAGLLTLTALGTAGMAVADPAPAPVDPNAVPAALLNTQCSVDQLMAATKVVDPIAYGAIVGKYNSEPRWLQGGVIYHLNLLMQKTPDQRQAEVDQLGGIFPEYMALFRTAEPTANAVAALCPTFPAENPAVWAANIG